MDYGKIAYLKVTDLESRQTSAATERQISRSYTVTPSYSFSGGAFPLVTLSASGDCALIVKARITVDAGKSGELFLSAGGIRLCSQRVVSGEQIVILIGAARISGEPRVEINCDCAAVLNSCEIVAVGAGGEFTRTGGGLAADKCGDVWTAVYSENDYVYAYIFSESNFDGGVKKLMCAGHIADVCKCGDGFAVATADRAGNVRLLITDYKGNSLKEFYISAEASAIAVSEVESGVVGIITVKNGDVFAIECDIEESAVTLPEKCDFSLAAKDVRFVKNSSPVMLIIQSDSGCVMRFLAQIVSSRSTFSYAVSVAYEYMW